VKAGAVKIKRSVAAFGQDENGWLVARKGFDRQVYAGDWTYRAAVAMAGIYANDPAEAFPPVNAFWSVTMYDRKTQLLIDNPINRYLINSPMLPDLKERLGRFGHDLYPKGPARPRQGVEAAASSGRPNLCGDATVLAERGRAKWIMEAARLAADEMILADDAKLLLRGLSRSGGHFTSHQILPVQLIVIGSAFRPRRR